MGDQQRHAGGMQVAASSERPEVELRPLTPEQLHDISLSRLPGHLAAAPEGALPPPHVVARALYQLGAGTPALWCLPFLIVDKPSGDILGGCTFKGHPIDGNVEIGYGVAASARGRGVATAAVARLLQLAAGGGVRQVVAHIVPDNAASAGVVSRLGFERGPTMLDPDGETVVRWIYPLAG